MAERPRRSQRQRERPRVARAAAPPPAAPGRPATIDASPPQPGPSRLHKGVAGAGRLGATIACLVGAFFATKVTIGAFWIASGDFEGGQAPFWWALVTVMALVAVFLAFEGARNLLALRALRRAGRQDAEEAEGATGPP